MWQLQPCRETGEKNFYHLRQLERQYNVGHGYHIRMVEERRTLIFTGGQREWNKEGNHTNKIEGQWRHMKASMPKFGGRKVVFRIFSGVLVALFA